MRTIVMPQTKKTSEFIPFKGGLDVVSPPVEIPPGFVRRAKNYEEDINGGYRSIMGYERFSGKPSPSTATFSVLYYSVRGTVAIGDTITGATSSATGKVIVITSTAFILTKVTGTWTDENTTAGGATVSGPALINALPGAYGAEYRSLAAAQYRSDIAAVPGSGSILGVYYFKGVVYAFRNEAAPATGVAMYKSSGSGWQAIALGYEVAFSNANTSVNDGDTLTQGGVTATINRVVVETGTLLSGVNTGRLIISAPSGGNFAAGAATSTSGGVVTLSGAEAAITIPNQNGRFEFITTNFYGQLVSQRMYGCDGVNYGFEYDGSVFVPIHTGTTVDWPTHVTAHQNHLFFSFGSSAIHSAIGDPYNWTTTAGGSEIAIGDIVTGFSQVTGSNASPALAIYCRSSTHMLYGSDASTWEKVIFNDQAGAISYSLQKVGLNYVMDDRGITSLQTAQEFGNFIESTVSKQVNTLLITKRSQLTDSHIARDKQQYRLFFGDKTALFCTVSRKGLSIMPVTLAHKVTCSVSEETYGGGSEVIFFGSDDGYVYQMERGTSFDGQEIEAYIDLVFNHSKGYRVLKKYRRMTFEMVGSGYSEFRTSYELSYGYNESAQPEYTLNTVDMGAPKWDQMTWDQFVWDGRPLTDLSMATPGDGDNISLRIYSKSHYFNPVKFSGVFLEYSPLRMRR